ncbi:heavy metal sensor histidine kinase [Vibrio sp. Of7-15]|uniref:heavy metal sensor histidine kinase n=1 Tax=Vibrio sp. Of7-15 TaxID=2724879 RepID=UPI001EF23704|nr:heavy metal sensor histidine kinase [Vibrio sp. Of7-15]MCG7499406.1 heavy metal sensor histidine kinase [Vibrio sp. Of7-15]
MLKLQPSLTANIASLFAISIIVIIITTAKVVFSYTYEYIDKHDQDALSSKLVSTLSIIENLSVEEATLFLDTLIGNTDDLALYLLNEEETEIYHKGPHYPYPSIQVFASDGLITDWKDGTNYYRGITLSQKTTYHGLLTAIIIMDTSKHQFFITELTHSLFKVFTIALISLTVIGYWISWRGLKPVRKLGKDANSINVTSLSTRLSNDKAPVELQPLIAALNNMLSRLESSFNKLSFFSTNLAHELRTPLSSMTLHNQIMLTGERTPQDYRETLTSNLEELEYLSKTITDMLLIAKAESNQLAIKTEQINLNKLSQKVSEYYQLLADQKSVSISVIGQVTCLSDSGLLRQIIGNLLSNAICYANQESTVKIILTENKSSIQIAVLNHGAPIPQAEQSMIFEWKYQSKVHTPSNTNEIHIGVGLTIVRSIVNAMKGHITLHSNNKATIFFVKLPK